MEKQRKPLSTKKPPIPSVDHDIIMNWMKNETMPAMQVLVKRVDELILEKIPNLQYSIKWGNAFYGTNELGWIIEVGAFAKSMNIVFLNGAKFERQPPLGSDIQTRYIKVSSIDEINDSIVIDLIEQAGQINGWK
jgi:hypothetical protein